MGEIARNHSYIIDMDKPLTKQSGVVFAEGDNGGDVFAFALQRNGAALTLYPSPEITGYFIRPDDTTVKLTGEGTGSSGTIRLPLACYALGGRCTLTVKATYDGVTTTILILDGYVKRTTTNVDPGSGGSGSSGGVVTVAGAVRYDIVQTTLTDEDKARARANIGVTSTGADISGLIDDDTSNSTGSSEKVWSSSKSQYNHNSQGILINSINTRVGTENLAIGDNVIDAINKVNAKVGSGTGGSSGGTVLTYGNCIGDSLMEGAGTKDADGDGAADYDTHSVPALLAAKTGLTMRNYGVGEEMIATIVGRQGGMPMILKPIDLNGTMRYPTIPANAVGVSISAIHFGSLAGESVTPLLKTSRMAVVGDGDINPCTIAGVEGTLTYDKATSVYTFTRTSTGGAAVPLKAPTIIRTKQMKDAGEGQFLLIWMGQNNTTDTTLNDDADAFADYLIERCKNAIDYAKTDKYIILGSPLANGYANATATAYKPIYSRMQSEFGMHYINIVDYLITYAMDEYNLQKKDTSIGMTSTSDEADIAMYRIPTSLRAVKKDTSGTITGPDYVHLNGTGYSIVADQVYKRGQLLGYW